MKRVFLFVVLFALTFLKVLAQDGAIDSNFNNVKQGIPYPSGANDVVYEIAKQSNQQFLIGGNFTYFNNWESHFICRIDSNGKIDSSFLSQLGNNYSGIKKIVVLPDGKILIGGAFGIARLHNNGVLDSTFNPSGSGANGYVSDILPITANKIIIAGLFTQYNSTLAPYLACLNQEGIVDTAFNRTGNGFDLPVYALARSKNNKILAGGHFFIYNGVVSQYLIQLNLDGSRDTTFTPADIMAGVNCLQIDNNGRIYAGGSFGVARLLETGVVDSTFDASAASSNLSGPVNKIKLLSDGNFLLASGEYDYPMRERYPQKNIFMRTANGSNVPSFKYFISDNAEEVYQMETTNGGKLLVCQKIESTLYRGFGIPLIYYSALPNFGVNRYLQDGEMDYSFNPEPNARGANKIIRAAVQQADGKTILAGSFYLYNGEQVNRLVRINIDGSIDHSFQTGNGPNKPVMDVAVQQDGKILLSGFFNSYNGFPCNGILRLHNDGSIDTTFNENVRLNGSFNLESRSICIRKNGKILVGTEAQLRQYNQDGTLDNNFNVSLYNFFFLPSTIYDIIEAKNNKLIFGGWFNADYSNSIFDNWARLNSDGSPDSSLLDEFGYSNNSNYNFSEVFALAEQEDDRILIGHGNLDRILPNGQLDTSFHRGSGFNGIVQSITLQEDGKILVGGSFTSYNGAVVNGLARLLSDGTLDMNYQASIYTNIHRIVIPFNIKNRIQVYGDFSSMQNQTYNGAAQIVNCQTSYDTLKVCAPQFPFIINGITYTSSGTYNQNLQTIDGCDSILTILLTALNNRPATPSSITQTLVSNLCGERVFRYTSSISNGALGYKWTIPQTISGVAGIYVDSGDINSSRIIRLKYIPNISSASTDSIKVMAFNGCGNSSIRSAKLNISTLNPPLAPSRIIVQSVTAQQCGYRTYRYIAPTLPSATSNRAAATGWKWEFKGSLAEFSWIDSGDINSQVVLVTYTINAAAGVGDSIKLSYSSHCGYGQPRAIKMTNLLLKAPTAPSSITMQSITSNICGNRRYRYIAPPLPSSTNTSGAATGYVWDFVGTLGSNVIIDSGSLNSQKFTATFTSNAASSIGDSIRVFYTSECGNSSRRSLKLTNTLLSPPTAPASITMTLVQNECGARIYRYTAPALPAATTANGAASGYDWMMPFGPLGSQGTLDSGSLTGRTIRILYPSNDAAQAGDSIRVRYNSACGYGPYKTMKLSNTAKTGCPPITKPSVPYTKNADVKVEVQKLFVLVYPNPSAQQFRLKLSSETADKVRVGIFDMQGKRISQMQLSANSVTEFGNGLKPGIYHLEVVQGDERQTVRIVKY